MGQKAKTEKKPGARKPRVTRYFAKKYAGKRITDTRTPQLPRGDQD